MAKASKKSKGPARGKSVTVAKVAPKLGGLIPLKAICAKLGLDPKKSRVRLRRAWRKLDAKGRPEGNLSFHEKNNRWDLSPAEAKEVTAILSAK